MLHLKRALLALGLLACAAVAVAQPATGKLKMDAAARLSDGGVQDRAIQPAAQRGEASFFLSPSPFVDLPVCV